MSSAITQQIINQLDQLPLELQRRVIDFTQALVISLPKGISGKQLFRFSGVIGFDDIRAMSQAIEEGCEKVNMDEW